MRVTLTEEAAAAAATAAACGSCGLNWTAVAGCRMAVPGPATRMPGGRGTNCTGADVLVTTVPAAAVGDFMRGARMVTGFSGRIVVEAPPTVAWVGAWTTVSLAPSGTLC